MMASRAKAQCSRRPHGRIKKPALREGPQTTFPTGQGVLASIMWYPMCKVRATIVLTGSSTDVTFGSSGSARSKAPRIQRSTHYARENCLCWTDFGPVGNLRFGPERRANDHSGRHLLLGRGDDREH